MLSLANNLLHLLLLLFVQLFGVYLRLGHYTFEFCSNKLVFKYICLNQR